MRIAFSRLFRPFRQVRRDQLIVAGIVFAFCTFVFVLPQSALATHEPGHEASGGILTSLEQGLAEIIGALAAMLGWLFTQLLLFLTELLVSVAQYNDFATADAVNRGWVIVRDLTNMFFILVMLIIAFGTILGVEEYSYKRMLPRLLIMAVVINFSKVICGLLIDFSQVIMLTFVNGFSAIAGGNFVQMFQVNAAWNLASGTALETAESSQLWGTVGALVLGALLMMIASAAVFILTLMLVGRIVMLWLLIVLSPLAFFLSAFPKGKAAEAYGKWWGLFGNYVVVGPFVAFFLWLSLAVAGAGDVASTIGASSTGGTALFVSELGGQQQFASFIISIALLLGGMQLSSQFGALGGGMMASTAQWVQKQGSSTKGLPFRFLSRQARRADSAIAARTGVSIGTLATLPANWAAGTEARIKMNYESGKKRATSAWKGGGSFGAVVGAMGATEEFARDTGVTGLAGAASRVFNPVAWARGGIRKRDSYLGYASEEQKKADDAKSQRMGAEQTRDAANAALEAKRASFEQLGAIDLKANDIAALQEVRYAAEQNGNTAQLEAIDALREKSGKGTANGGDIENLQKAGIYNPRMNKLLVDAEQRLQGANLGSNYSTARSNVETAAITAATAQANVNRFGAAETTAQGNVEKWVRAADRARISGVTQEVPKHSLDAAAVTPMLQEALKNKDFTLAQQLIVKLGDDGELGDALKLQGYGEGLSAVKKFAADLEKGKGMPRGAIMSTLSEVDAKYKSKGNTEYSGMVKGGPGGRLDFVSDAQYQQSRHKAGDKGSMVPKLGEANRTSLFQTTNEKGEKVIDAAGAALIAAHIGDVFKSATENRMSGDMMRMFVDKQKEVMQAVQDAGIAAQSDQFKQLEKAIEHMNDRLKTLPPEVGAAIRKVEEARKKRGA